jgi:hypothetical protein
MSGYVRPDLNESPIADRGSSLLAVAHFGLGQGLDRDAGR